MVGILRRKQLQSLAIEPDAVQVGLIRVFALLAPVGHEVDPPILFVDVLNLLDHPRTLRYLVLQLSSFLVVDVEMIPAIALGRPKNLSSRLDKAVKRFARIQVRIRLLAHHNFLLSCRSVHDAQFLRLVSAFVVVIEKGSCCRRTTQSPGPPEKEDQWRPARRSACPTECRR